MSNLEVTQFNAVDEITDQEFEDLGCANNFYFSKSFLKAFESGNEQINYTYLIIRNQKEAIALAIIQDFYISLEKNQTVELPKIIQKLQLLQRRQKFQIAICGNLFLSGTYGVWVKDKNYNKQVYDLLSRKLNSILTIRKPQLYFFKDFNDSQKTTIDLLKQRSFNSFKVEPNMRLQLSTADFENYKASLKAKYRNKINKADQRSEQLVVRSLSSAQIQDKCASLQSLFDQIWQKTALKTVKFNVQTYISLKSNFPNNVFVKSYTLQNTMVGFSTAFLNGNTLDAHYVGFDPSLNKKYAIYPRMLNDYVRLGCDLDVSEINFGRTASEIKSTLGAQPEDLTCYVKHAQPLINTFLSPFTNQMDLPEYKLHHPFKKSIL